MGVLMTLWWFFRASADLSVQYRCFVLQPMTAALLLLSASPFGLPCATMAFRLKTRVSHITAVVSIGKETEGFC